VLAGFFVGKDNVAWWKMKRYVVEFEQAGMERAVYGTGLLKNLSRYLADWLGTGYSHFNINYMRMFTWNSQFWRRCLQN